MFEDQVVVLCPVNSWRLILWGHLVNEDSLLSSHSQVALAYMDAGLHSLYNMLVLRVTDTQLLQKLDEVSLMNVTVRPQMPTQQIPIKPVAEPF